MNSLSCTPDTVLYNAHVYTVEAQQPWAEAVAVRDGVIVAVGDSKDVLSLAEDGTDRIDMGGRLALPGFCDAHIHFLDWSLAQSQVSFYDTRSKAEMMDRIRSRAYVTAGDGWIEGRGWNETWWGDVEYPLAADVDAVTGPNQAAIFYRTDMHSAVVNSRALMLARITSETPDPTGGVIDRDAHGKPTGMLRESATLLVEDLIPQPTHEQRVKAVRDGIDELHRIGVTAVHDQRVPGPGNGASALRAYQELNDKGELALRINCNFAAYQLPHIAELGLQYGLGDDRLHLGHVKVFADGSLGSQTALMLEPFEKEQLDDPNNTGVRLTEPTQIAEWFYNITSLGFPISIHAIGDRANREVLDLFEELASNLPATRTAHRIEHVQIIKESDIGRLGELAITASVQPIHVIDDIAIAERILGERSIELYRFNSLLKSGGVLAFGSDAPVADPNPFMGIHSALYRQRPDMMEKGSWYADECVTLEEAIYAYTMGPAIATGWEDTIGSITPGKRADIIAIDRNLFDVVSGDLVGDEVAATQVEFVMFDGAITVDNL